MYLLLEGCSIAVIHKTKLAFSNKQLLLMHLESVVVPSTDLLILAVLAQMSGGWPIKISFGRSDWDSQALLRVSYFYHLASLDMLPW